MARSTTGTFRFLRGLSGRVLAVTLLLVLLLEAAIFLPAIANQWRDLLNERLAAAHVAALVRDAAMGQAITPELRGELLDVVGVYTIALRREDFRQLVLTDNSRLPVTARIDLRTANLWARWVGACATLMRGGEGQLQVVGPVEKMPGEYIEIVLSEQRVYADLQELLRGGIGAALLLALVLGAVLYFILSRALVAPVQRITQSMLAFSDDPENPTHTLPLWERRDEIGVAARQLRGLQLQLRDLLGQKQRLAGLGAAVARINHDLRNLFSTLQLVSDTLQRVEDPRVQRAAPRLMRALDRGIKLCEATLEYGRQGDVETDAKPQVLRPIVEEVAHLVVSDQAEMGFEVDVEAGFEAICDADHLFRILSNLARNALQAMDNKGTIRISARMAQEAPVLDIYDTGPGIPEHIQKTLFEAFGKSGSVGGSGLGLAIARELARAQGGDLVLKSTGPIGSCFRLSFASATF